MTVQCVNSCSCSKKKKKIARGDFTQQQQQLEMVNLIYNIFDSWPARSMQSSALFFFSFLHLFGVSVVAAATAAVSFLWHFSFFYFLFRFCRLFKTFSLSFSICVF